MAGRRPTKTKPKKKSKVVTKARVAKPKAKAKAKAQAAKLAPRKKRSVVATKPKKLTVAKARAKIEPPLPSERALATAAQLPVERPLSDEERAAMMKVAETARRHLYSALGTAGAVKREVSAEGVPQRVVERIASFVEEVRLGTRPEPKSQDVRLGLGVLWGEQVRAQVGWCWVHLTYADGFASYALVPDDRAFACFPLNRVPEAMKQEGRTNTTAAVFASIREGMLPTRKPNAYLVIG